MSEANKNQASGVLNRFTGMYLTTRMYVGAGLVAFTLVLSLFDLGAGSTWVLGVAGLIIVAHAMAMQETGTKAVLRALIVDVTATHAAVLVLAIWVGEPLTPGLTVLTATIIIGLFSDGWRRSTLIGYSTGFSLLALYIIEGRSLVGTLDEIIAVLFVVGLVAGVITAVRHSLVGLEAARAQTLGVVSHEVRNHLTGVIGATELMLDAGTELTAEETVEMIGLAHGQAVEAAEVIEDLMVVSRAERGVLDAAPEPVDLIPLTESVIRRSSVDGGHISIDSPDDVIWAMADALRYKQIIRNLLTNAFDYGGPTVEVSIQYRHEGVAVTVADDGEGIEPAAAKELFQPYHGAGTAGRKPGSTGLGLWIARDLAKKMGGDLVYRLKDGLTLFELTLPAAQPPTRPTPHPRTAASIQPSLKNS